jgi:hypothetical protein
LNNNDAVRLLLNDTTLVDWSNQTTLDLSKNANGKNLNLITASNKSVIIAKGSALVQDGPLSVNGASINTSLSSFVYDEQLQYRLDVPDNGIYSITDLPGVTVTTQIPASQADVDLQHQFRLNNDPFWNTLGLSNHPDDLLGVEGKFQPNINNSLQPYAPHGTLADSNINLTINKTLPSVGSYNYKIHKLEWASPTMQITNTSVSNNIIVKQDGSTVLNLTVNINDFLGTIQADDIENYHGLMTTEDFNDLSSTQVVINVQPGNATYYDNPFFPKVGNSGKVNLLSCTDIDISSVGELFPKTDLSATLSGNSSLVADSSVNNDNLSVVLSSSELLPVGKTTSDATVTFDSTSRSTVESDFGATVTVVYESDNKSDITDVTGENVGVLSNQNMTTESVSYSGSIVSPSTSDSTNATAISSTNSNGMVFFTENSSSFTLSNVDTEQNNIFGVLYQNGNLTLREVQGTDGTLLSLTQGIEDYKLDLTFNDVNGSEISGRIANEYVQQGGAAVNGLRLHFEALNFFEEMTVTAVNQNMGEVANPSFSYGRQDQLAVYDINYDISGPVRLYNYPTSGTYSQTYQVTFPSGDKALFISSRNSGLSYNNTPSVVPEFVKINGYIGSEKISEREVDIRIIPEGTANANFKNITQSDSNNIRTISGVVSVPLTFSGVSDETGSVQIPISYSYQLSGSSYQAGPLWVSNQVPSSVVRLTLLGKNISNTHLVTLQGSADVLNTTNDPKVGQWTVLGQNISQLVDLRLDNAIVLDHGLNFNLACDMYVPFDSEAPSVYMVNYVISLEWVNSAWAVRYATFDNNVNLLKNNSSLSKNAIKTMVETLTISNMTSASVLLQDNGNNSDYNVSGGVTFSVNMVDSLKSTVYFARLSKTLVTINSRDLLVSSDDIIKVDNGVYVSFGQALQQQTEAGQSLVSISLNKDKYVASAYDSQSGNAWNSLRNIPSNLVLIPNVDANSVQHSSIVSSIYRGFADGSSYSFHRGSLSLTVSWGGDEETQTIVPPSNTQPSQATFNLNNNYGIIVNVVGSPSSSQADVSLFSPNIANVSVTVIDSLGVPTTTIQTTASTFDLTSATGATNTPFFEFYKLSTFYVRVQNGASVSLNYQQSNIKLSTYVALRVSTIAPLVGTAGWTTVADWSDSTLLSNPIRSYFNLTFEFLEGVLKHRILGKSFIISVLPLSLSVSLSGSSNSQTFDITSLPITRNFPEIKSTLNISNILDITKLSEKFRSESYFTFNKKKLLLTIHGSQSEFDDPNPVWNTYVNSVQFSETRYQFLQANTAQSAQEYITIDFSSTNLAPIYNASTIYGWSGTMRYTSGSSVVLTQYVLKFEMDNATKRNVPVVYKYESTTFNPASTVVTSGNGGSQDHINGFVKRFPVRNASKLLLDIAVDFPYNYLNASNYPSLSNASVMLSSSDFTPVAVSSIPPYLDFIVNVRDYNVNNDGTFTDNTAGTDLFKQVLGPEPNQYTYLSVFAKDQLVVKNHMGVLSTRVGPDGQFYTSDINLYSMYLHDNKSQSINHSLNSVYNSQVSLTYPSV